ncbi:MAG: hypothetical protein COT81_03690 [Candidatus Buchananbacteria bacterium CG10_big_fil_rev_8_21_14_0_10_42_9]|uniref:DUF5673 domain-containing protein n=1 Tax=Candidatus Buchananbacteria bacterium CG10_big_fil_rev_8_21_14_0_10_42_9 TaxID=1974526 RepID=A0A2H0W2T5_9BACT|nr:MAG: hypothetical protein COT81_03690 [Candidatus Buchananbacteria bacterium CG10_big_fil_rev_8_21_14_0_10_42_9]
MPERINQPHPEVDHGEVLANWSFPEYISHNRGAVWFVAAGILALFLIIYGIATSNLLFALIVILAVLLSYMHQRNIQMVDFTINEDGIIIAQHFFPWNELDKFYIIYQPPDVKALYFEPKSIWQPRISVDLVDQNPVAIRRILLKYLTEDFERENEPLSDQLTRLLKL